MQHLQQHKPTLLQRSRTNNQQPQQLQHELRNHKNQRNIDSTNDNTTKPNYMHPLPSSVQLQHLQRSTANSSLRISDSIGRIETNGSCRVDTTASAVSTPVSSIAEVDPDACHLLRPHRSVLSAYDDFPPNPIESVHKLSERSKTSPEHLDCAVSETKKGQKNSDFFPPKTFHHPSENTVPRFTPYIHPPKNVDLPLRRLKSEKEIKSGNGTKKNISFPLSHPVYLKEVLKSSHKVTAQSITCGLFLSSLLERPAWDSNSSSLEILVGDDVTVPNQALNHRNQLQEKRQLIKRDRLYGRSKITHEGRINEQSVCWPIDPPLIRAGLSKYHLSSGCHILNHQQGTLGTLGLTSPTEIVFLPLTSLLGLTHNLPPPCSTTILTETPCFICLPTTSNYEPSSKSSSFTKLHLLRNASHNQDSFVNPNCKDDLYHIFPLSDVEFRSTDIIGLLQETATQLRSYEGNNNTSLMSNTSSLSDWTISDEENDVENGVDRTVKIWNSDINVATDGHNCSNKKFQDRAQIDTDAKHIKRTLSTMLKHCSDMEDAVWIIEPCYKGRKSKYELQIRDVETRIPQCEYLVIVVEQDNTEFTEEESIRTVLNDHENEVRSKFKKSICLGLHGRQEAKILEHEQFKSLQYSLRLNSASEPTDPFALWCISYAIRPSEPLWMDEHPHILQSAHGGPAAVKYASRRHPFIETHIASTHGSSRSFVKSPFISSQYLSENHLKSPLEFLPPTIPLKLQELLLIEDLMFCFMGVPGQFIKFKYCADELQRIMRDTPNVPVARIESSAQLHSPILEILKSKPDDSVFFFFQMEPLTDGRMPIDISLLQMVEKILTICRVHRKLCHFAETHWNIKYGLCSQALSEAMKELLKEFQTRITQLESQHAQAKVSLQRLWFYLQPAASSFSVLEQVVDAVSYKRGGKILNGIVEVTGSSARSGHAHRLCQFLLEKSSVPFTTMLARWIYEGMIDDPHEEFFISDNPTIDCNSQEIVSSKELESNQNWRNQVNNDEELINDAKKDIRYLKYQSDSCGTNHSNDIPHFLHNNEFNNIGMVPFGGHPLWYLKFTLKPKFIPEFLKPLAVEALDAGKHLNVLSSVQSNQQSLVSLSHRNSDETLDTNETQTCDTRTIPKLDNTISPLDRSYCHLIREASISASHQLMQYLLVTCDLKRRLTSLRRFILCARSDFLSNFLSLMEDEVKLNPVLKTATRLNYLLDTAVETSSLAKDKYRSEIKCTLSAFLVRDVSAWFESHTTNHAVLTINNRLTITNQMIAEAAGLDYQHCPFQDHQQLPFSKTHSQLLDDAAQTGGTNDDVVTMAASRQKTYSERFQELLKYLALTFEFEWPLNLIFSRIAIIKYELLSRLIIQLKHTEKKLNEVWQIQMRTRPYTNDSPESPKNFRYSSALRLRMLHLVRNFTFYVTIEVLEPRFHEFYSKLKNAKSLDDVIQLHDEFLNTCLNETLLTEPTLIRSFSKVLTVCHLFTSSTSRFSLYRMEKSATKASNIKIKRNINPSTITSTTRGAGEISTSDETYGLVVKQFTAHFDKNLESFLRLLLEKSICEPKYSTHIYNLLTRLDFNGYYSKLLNIDVE